MVDIAPDKQNIDSVFANTVYHIDFYQRDYKWTKEPVERLLDDIFHKFNQEYSRLDGLDPSKETIMAKYPWYYLNTYVTNTIDGKVYVVDGQQRLTTLTLVLIKLYRMASEYGSKGAERWLENKLVGYAGFEASFWMNHERHTHVLEGLKDGLDFATIDTSSGVTAVNMLQNYRTIDVYFDRELPNQHKLDTFVFYFLCRLVLINLAVEQTDVPMVFEVINDRGVRLRPYEIIKGKLLGQIDKLELDQRDYNGLWERQVQTINDTRDTREAEIDNFFRYYLKAKYADTQGDATRFDGDYHREMFNRAMADKLKLSHSPECVKAFLNNTFKYYTNLYLKVLKATEAEQADYPCVFLNRLNEMDSQFLLILSSCRQDDPEEDLKIAKVSAELDRFFSLLQLQNAYESNVFGNTIYRISADIRDKPASDVRSVFDTHLMRMLSNRRSTEVSEPFQYAFFKNTGINLNARFKRYFFARVERFLCDEANKGMSHPVKDLVSKTGYVNGFHIEHILSHNEANHSLFDDDEDVFEQERNRLGGLLLLKGRDNIFSSNELYSEKIKTYANTLYWNATLHTDTYKANGDLDSLKQRHGLDIQAYDAFGPEQLEFRQRLLFKISSILWA